MVLLRHLLGDALRRLRLRQGRTLREVSAAARVSLGYLSEVERGRKEASSELLASICDALGAPLSQVLREVSDTFALAELQNAPVFTGVREPSPEVAAEPQSGAKQPVAPPATQRVLVPAPPSRTAVPADRLVVPARQNLSGQNLTRQNLTRQNLTGRTGQRILPPSEPLVGPALPSGQPAFDQVARTARDITDMVPV
jgi:transcriptional regulator with XRE-family HTH domain